jgi:hypothetical protein
MTGIKTGKPVGRQWLKSDKPVGITGNPVPKPINHFFKKSKKIKNRFTDRFIKNR